MTTLTQLRDSIYEILSRSATTYGLLTPTKVDAMINDSFDYISSIMMEINGGWLRQRSYINVVGGTASYSLPSGTAVVNFLKIKSSASDDYVPLAYNENWDGVTLNPLSNVGNIIPFRWSFVNNQVFLEPTPVDTVAQGILVDAVFFPAVLTQNSDPVTGDMDNRIFVQYAKWRSASQLWYLTTDAPPPWEKTEMEWRSRCQKQISRRFREPTPIRDFDRY